MALTPERRIRLIGWALATGLHLTAGVLILCVLPMGDLKSRPSLPQTGLVMISLIHSAPETPPSTTPLPPGPAAGPVAIDTPVPPQAHAAGATPASYVPPTPSAVQPALLPSAGDAPSATSEFAGADADRFRETLLAHIARFRRYPADAQRDHVEGTVWLRFVMDRSGHVINVWVDQSSGQRALDDEAVSAVRRADPLPAIPSGLPDRVDLTLPVSFSLG